MIKGWNYSEKRTNVKIDCPAEFGCVYAVKINVCQGLTLVKIGATREPNIRLANFPKRIASIFCVSPPHLNFFENEDILHKHFSKFRVPSRVGHEGPEFFNLSLPFFFDNLPELTYVKHEEEAQIIESPVYGRFFFAKK